MQMESTKLSQVNLLCLIPHESQHADPKATLCGIHNRIKQENGCKNTQREFKIENKWEVLGHLRKVLKIFLEFGHGISKQPKSYISDHQKGIERKELL